MESDREAIIRAGKQGGLPHCLFFRNGCGFPGGQSSGLVVLSRWPITSSFYHRFSAAGKAQKVLHWDYKMFSGKGIGCVQIEGPPQVGPIDLFVSHFVAYYTPHVEQHGKDEYVHHRRLGAWEASQFIKRVARKDSLVLCCVDLNADPETLTYRSLRGLADLGDAWASAGRVRKGVLPDALAEVERLGLTCNYPGNCFHENNQWTASGEPSARVDYILYRVPENNRLSLEWCERRFTGPDDTDSIVSLSDHSAVLASFHVRGDVQPRSVETFEQQVRTAAPSTKAPVADVGCVKDIMADLGVSSELGIACANGRSAKAVTKAYVFFVAAVLCVIVSHFFEWDSSLWNKLGQFFLSTVFLVIAKAYWVLGNITIPDEASAMMFMRESIRLELNALMPK